MRTKGSKNKNPAKSHVNIRLSAAAVEYFRKYAKKNSMGYTVAMRDVLERAAGVKPDE